MTYYKVHFENNTATTAERLFDARPDDIIRISDKNNQRSIIWLVVYADSESDAIRVATDILNKYRTSFGLSDPEETK